METVDRQSNKRMFWGVIAGCLLTVLCLCGLTAFLVGTAAYQVLAHPQVALITSTPDPNYQPLAIPTNPATATPEPSVPITVQVTLAPPPTITLNLPVPDDINQAPVPAQAITDLQTLLTVDIPVHDYFAVANRLDNESYGDRIVPAEPYVEGEIRSFYADDITFNAELIAITEHAYFWLEEGSSADPNLLREAAERFERDYYPTLTAFFGEVWTPGVDGDPRFSVVHLEDSGNDNELGYFTDVNQYPVSLYSDSNQQEMIYMNLSLLEAGSELYDGTLVHEIQHLIQWHVDPNESAWMNEGYSQLAEHLFGLDTVTTYDYQENPTIRLNSWPYDDADAIDAHYAGAYLYMVYLWEQLGETAVQELVRSSSDSLTAVAQTLAQYAPDRSLGTFTADWAVANYLDDPNSNPLYGYTTLDPDRAITPYKTLATASQELGKLNQFGVHYYELDVTGKFILQFSGDTQQALFPTPPNTEQAWYAPPRSNINPSLTAQINLENISEASLTFDAWYDLEEDWDFAYLTVSTDGGETWEFLTPEHRSSGAFGPAFNGSSEQESDSVNGWVSEVIPLNVYRDQTILLRLELVTDSAIEGKGVALANLAIPELGLGEEIWQADGFTLVSGVLPQQWEVRLIEDNTTVTALPLDGLNQGEWRLSLTEDAVLLILPVTPLIDSPATYWFNLKESAP